ncbi:MAG: outer membrane lipoprotein carrier protein LolA [Azoarcus sp.]|jgi:hypothetical protein|nr:outer membrane lipoprotein carrier protein LolA [Azoarcus sp.]
MAIRVLFYMLCTAFCFLNTFPAFAADVLNEIRTQLVISPCTQGEFQQTRKLAQIKKPLISTGRFFVAQGLGVIWENIAPIPQTMRLTKNELLQTDGHETLSRLDASKEPVIGIINSILFGVLSGDFDALTPRFAHDGKQEGSRWRLVFTPRDSNLARVIQSLTLAGGRDIDEVDIQSAAGDVTHIQFKNLIHNKTVPDDVKKRFE